MRFKLSRAGAQILDDAVRRAGVSTVLEATGIERTKLWRLRKGVTSSTDRREIEEVAAFLGLDLNEIAAQPELRLWETVIEEAKNGASRELRAIQSQLPDPGEVRQVTGVVGLVVECHGSRRPRAIYKKMFLLHQERSA